MSKTYIHPTAVIGPNVIIGNGVYIGPLCIIGMPAEHKETWDNGECGMVNIEDGAILTGLVTVDSGIVTPEKTGITWIGKGAYIMKHAHVGHDAIISQDVVLSCGAKIGGHAYIMRGSNVGLNACIHQRVIIPPFTMVGMGAVVTKKAYFTGPYETWAGNPAKYIKKNEVALARDGREAYTTAFKHYLENLKILKDGQP